MKPGLPRRAVFIDKDGTIIPDEPFNIKPSLIRLYDDAGEALKLLQQHGYLLMIVTNQSGIARGYFGEDELRAAFDTIRKLLKQYDVHLDDIYYCPHALEGENAFYVKECECRKPRPGLLLRAARQHGVSLNDSWMIGDILHDVEAGNRAGCRSILVDHHNETEWIMTNSRRPFGLVSNLRDAVKLILATDHETR
jgi:D,D-heptose 1,7-bisphosphate phosphatase